MITFDLFIRSRRLLSITVFWVLSGRVFAVDIQQSVVKIFTVSSSYNYYQPWQKRSQIQSTGSGVIIDGFRILTNAHVVSNRTLIQVKRSDQVRKYIAKILYIAHESDLAVLTIDDAEFFANTRPIPIGGLPKVRSKVSVYGFPRGGNELSVTEGVVSRIEHRHYSHSSAYLLACQIDAAINPGNSGGPVIFDGKIVGVAFQAVGAAENIGYMVPAPVVRHFLQDIRDHRYDGIPGFPMRLQNMENEDLRRYYKMAPSMSGILVIGMDETSYLKNYLHIHDVLLQIGPYPIENDGSIAFRGSERTFYEFAIETKQLNDSIPMVILRDGKKKTLKIPLKNPINSHRLVPYEKFDTPPSYFLSGGLLFEPLTKNLLQEWGNQWYNKAPKNLLYYYKYGEKSSARDEVVLLVKVLADEINIGYHNWANVIIRSVNGKMIRNMTDLVAAFDRARGDYIRVIGERGRVIILDRRKIREANQRIRRRYRVPRDRSENFRADKI